MHCVAATWYAHNCMNNIQVHLIKWPVCVYGTAPPTHTHSLTHWTFFAIQCLRVALLSVCERIYKVKWFVNVTELCTSFVPGYLFYLLLTRWSSSDLCSYFLVIYVGWVTLLTLGCFVNSSRGCSHIKWVVATSVPCLMLMLSWICSCCSARFIVRRNLALPL